MEIGKLGLKERGGTEKSWSNVQAHLKLPAAKASNWVLICQRPHLQGSGQLFERTKICTVSPFVHSFTQYPQNRATFWAARSTAIFNIIYRVSCTGALNDHPSGYKKIMKYLFCMFHELSKIEKRLGDLWDLRLQSHFQMLHQLILKFLVKF